MINFLKLMYKKIQVKFNSFFKVPVFTNLLIKFKSNFLKFLENKYIYSYSLHGVYLLVGTFYNLIPEFVLYKNKFLIVPQLCGLLIMYHIHLGNADIIFGLKLFIKFFLLIGLCAAYIFEYTSLIIHQSVFTQEEIKTIKKFIL